MATFARAPERTLMRIVLAVTRIAIRCRHNLRDVPGRMAGVTIEIAVRTRQGVVRLGVVIEAPPLPAIRIVAVSAVWS